MTENELLNELVAELQPAPLQLNEVTSKMLAAATGVSQRTAYARLERGVREGELEWRWVKNKLNGLREKAYFKITH